MNRVSLTIGLFLTSLLPLPATAADEHAVVSPDNLKWGAAPPAFPKGAQIAVLSGEACQSLLLKMRDEGFVKFDIHKGRWLVE
jgi:hypothetical protein